MNSWVVLSQRENELGWAKEELSEEFSTSSRLLGGLCISLRSEIRSVQRWDQFRDEFRCWNDILWADQDGFWCDDTKCLSNIFWRYVGHLWGMLAILDSRYVEAFSKPRFSTRTSKRERSENCVMSWVVGCWAGLPAMLLEKRKFVAAWTVGPAGQA